MPESVDHKNRDMQRSFHASFNRSSNLSDRETENLKQGTWEIDCPNMTLKGRSKSNAVLFSGAGLIRQNADRGFTFKLYSTGQRNFDASTWNALRSGTIVPDCAFYDLVAQDSKGREWHSHQLLPNFNQTAQGKYIMEGYLSFLSSEGRIPGHIRIRGSSIAFKVFAHIEIPKNETTIKRQSTARGQQRSVSRSFTAWKFKSSGLDFLVVEEVPEVLTINVRYAKSKLPPNLETRIIETFQFVLGKPIPWTILQKRAARETTTVLQAQPLRRMTSRLMAPLPPRRIIDHETNKLTTAHHRRLFANFLKHIIDSDQPQHPLWGQLNAAYEASASTFLDAKALTLTVAIESIIAGEFSELGNLSQPDKKAVETALLLLQNWNGDEKIKSRIIGSVRQILNARTGDRMRELVTRRAITPEQNKAWQKLRNVSAHSYQLSSIAHEKFIKLVQQNEVLFYHLIFCAIGYEGPYLDFSSEGWPIRQYPQNPRRRRSAQSIESA